MPLVVFQRPSQIKYATSHLCEVAHETAESAERRKNRLLFRRLFGGNNINNRRKQRADGLWGLEKGINGCQRPKLLDSVHWSIHIGPRQQLHDSCLELTDGRIDLHTREYTFLSIRLIDWLVGRAVQSVGFCLILSKSFTIAQKTFSAKLTPMKNITNKGNTYKNSIIFLNFLNPKL